MTVPAAMNPPTTSSESPANTTFIGRNSDLRFGPAVAVSPTTLDALLAQAAQTHADNLATVGDGGPQSFAELDRRSSAIARYLRNRGIGTGDRVVVVTHRCGWLPAVVTGIIRAGAVYVPVDATYPAERVAFIIDDCEPAAVFALGGAALGKDLSDRLARAGVITATITNDSPLGTAILDGSADPSYATTGTFTQAEQSRAIAADDACYIIYTSGTTGTPKGALNTHLGVTAHIQWMDRMLTPSSTIADSEAVPLRMLHKAPVSFDVGIAELLIPLGTGGTVVLPDPEWWPGDVDALIQMITDHNVTVLSMVPSLMRVIVDVLDDMDIPLSVFATIQYLLFGGEAVPADLVRRSRAEIGCRVYGLYGPTETAMDVTWVEYTDDLIAAKDFDGRASLLGLPEENVACYLIDDTGLEVDPNSENWDAPGELYLAGPQVGQGYLNRSELTAKVFLPSLHPELDGGRMYRTGDIAAWTEVGERRLLHFLGRIGDQVKIRGNRVELGEVESRMRDLPGIHQAAVIVDQGGNPTGTTGAALVGFVVMEDGAHLDPNALAAEMGTLVPAYMVPSRIVAIDVLPMNLNGKLDRRALADLDSDIHKQVSPRTQ